MAGAGQRAGQAAALEAVQGRAGGICRGPVRRAEQRRASTRLATPSGSSKSGRKVALAAVAAVAEGLLFTPQHWQVLLLAS